MGNSVDPMLILGKAVDMSVSMRGGDFPLSAMPMKIQWIIREANDCYGYPVDYLAGAMLVALGLGIGNTHFARLKGKWDESAILFMALVGRPGACKSHPLNFAIRPFSDIDGVNNSVFQKELAEYNRQCELPMKERSVAHPVMPVNIIEYTEPISSRFTLVSFRYESQIFCISLKTDGLILKNS